MSFPEKIYWLLISIFKDYYALAFELIWMQVSVEEFQLGEQVKV